jgi:hypothetical protein
LNLKLGNIEIFDLPACSAWKSVRRNRLILVVAFAVSAVLLLACFAMKAKVAKLERRRFFGSAASVLLALSNNALNKMPGN